jgi:hypothetical protein
MSLDTAMMILVETGLDSSPFPESDHHQNHPLLQEYYLLETNKSVIFQIYLQEIYSFLLEHLEMRHALPDHCHFS